MSPAPSGSLVLKRIELSDALEIRDGIIFEFYPGLPRHVKSVQLCEYIFVFLLLYRTQLRKMLRFVYT